MKIATHNSEKLLLADLREAKISNPTNRFLFLRLSNVKEKMGIWLPRLERSIRHNLGDVVEQIYLTDDGDVFIYGFGLTQIMVNDLVFDFSEALDTKSLQGLAHLYEVGIDFDTMEALAMCKIREIEKRDLKEKKIQQNNKNTETNIIAEVDQKLAETIDARRQARAKPEILIVEDDLFSQTLVKKALSDYSLSVAADGQGAILNYVKTAPDICFLDIELPDTNGHEVLKQIKSLDENAFVVMFSGNGDRENIMRALDLGAQGFVGKPFAKEKLHQYVAKSPFVIQRNKGSDPSQIRV